MVTAAAAGNTCMRMRVLIHMDFEVHIYVSSPPRREEDRQRDTDTLQHEMRHHADAATTPSAALTLPVTTCSDRDAHGARNIMVMNVERYVGTVGLPVQHVRGHRGVTGAAC